MRNKRLMLSGIILLALAFTISIGVAQDNPTKDDKSIDIVDDIKPYEGSIGPGSVLYGLKIAIENMGEAFTFNETEKVKSQVEHAELRIAEAKAELKNNNTEAANSAIERYREKIQATDDRLSGMRRNEPELLDAQERIIKHQLVLRRLRESQPDNRGLETALDNSKRLEEKFELRTRVKLEREIGDDRQRVRVREIEIERNEIEAEVRDNTAQVKVKVRFLSGSTDREAISRQVLDKIKLAKDDIAGLIKIEGEVRVTATATAARTPSVTGTPEREDRERLKIEVEAGKGVSEVEAEIRFQLNTADRNAIIEGISQKLSALTIDDVRLCENYRATPYVL